MAFRCRKLFQTWECAFKVLHLERPLKKAFGYQVTTNISSGEMNYFAIVVIYLPCVFCNISTRTVMMVSSCNQKSNMRNNDVLKKSQYFGDWVWNDSQNYMSIANRTKLNVRGIWLNYIEERFFAAFIFATSTLSDWNPLLFSGWKTQTDKKYNIFDLLNRIFVSNEALNQTLAVHEPKNKQ